MDQTQSESRREEILDKNPSYNPYQEMFTLDDLRKQQFRNAITQLQNDILDLDSSCDDQNYYFAEAHRVLAELFLQRFDYVVMLLTDNFNDEVHDTDKATATGIFSEIARKNPLFHIEIGMLNANAEAIKRIKKLYPRVFNTVLTMLRSYLNDTTYSDRGYCGYYTSEEFLTLTIDIER